MAVATAERYRLPVHGFRGTAEEIERQWYEKVYLGRGDSMRQLTWRAVVMGSVLGGVLSLTNLYIGLTAGGGFGVAITACILSYAIWTTLYRVGVVGTPMTILENNCMQSTASSAGYSDGQYRRCARPRRSAGPRSSPRSASDGPTASAC
jgi:OPT oligopeptide transporter protein